MRLLSKAKGGSGILLAGVPGVRPGKVTILGAGTVGMNATKMAVGLGADVTVLNKSASRLIHLDELYGLRINKVPAGTYPVGTSRLDGFFLFLSCHY